MDALTNLIGKQVESVQPAPVGIEPYRGVVIGYMHGHTDTVTVLRPDGRGFVLPVDAVKVVENVPAMD